MKILTIIGARPQFIKAAPVALTIASHNRRCQKQIIQIIIHTGQHYNKNMSDIFFKGMEIPAPDYNLGIHNCSHGSMTGRMLEQIERIILKEKPDVVLVYGDTNSTLAGALAAAKLQITVSHIEAGLRSFNRRMPEEINRILTDHVSDILFAPTTTAMNNILNEGIGIDKIYLVGDVMYDVALYYAHKAEQRSRILARLGVQPGGYILATVHRAENTDVPQRLRVIFEALREASKEIPIVLPLHPRTRKALRKEKMIDQISGRVLIITPVSYLDMIMLEKNARLIVTDSGGVQKEAFFYRVPCVTLREETEWLELVDLGWNKLVAPDDSSKIVKTILSHIDKVGNEGNPFGEGRAAEAIVHTLYSLLGSK